MKLYILLVCLLAAATQARPGRHPHGPPHHGTGSPPTYTGTFPPGFPDFPDFTGMPEGMPTGMPGMWPSGSPPPFPDFTGMHQRRQAKDEGEPHCPPPHVLKEELEEEDFENFFTMVREVVQQCSEDEGSYFFCPNVTACIDGKFEHPACEMIKGIANEEITTETMKESCMGCHDDHHHGTTTAPAVAKRDIADNQCQRCYHLACAVFFAKMHGPEESGDDQESA